MLIKAIEESFIYKELSDEEYFSEEYKDYISNSQLGLINKAQGGDPIRFLQGFKKAEMKALLIGTSIHRLVLEKDVYEISEIEKPTGKLGLIAHDVFKYRQEGVSIYDSIKTACISNKYWANKITDKRITSIIKDCFTYYKFLKKKDESKMSLTPANKEIVTNCVPSVIQYFKPQKGIEEYNEFPIFATFLYWHEELQKMVCVKLKCKIDNYKIDHKNKRIILVDLKTTGSSVSSFISEEMLELNEDGTKLLKKKYLGSFYKYHYYRQMGFYGHMLQKYCELTLGLVDYKIEYKMVVVETNHPFRSDEFEISEELIKLGEEEFIYLLNEVLFYQEKGFDYIK